MTAQMIEVAKFRSIYRYSYDDEFFYLFWKKGATLVHDKYPLSEMSANLEHWGGRPQSTISNVKKFIFWLVLSILIFLFSSSSWMVLIGISALIVSLHLILNEVGFLFPVSATVLSYEDNSGGVYMFHGQTRIENWSSFEKGLANAINASKVERT